MANIREIQSRIHSIEDTMKITNAMYMISSTKLRKAKKKLEETEPYFFELQSTLAKILRHIPDIENSYFDKREKKKNADKVKAYIVVTADKGLAGSYNHNVLKLAESEIKKAGKSKLFVVGELGRHYFATQNVKVEEQFHYTAQNPSLHRARIISETVIEQYLAEEIDEVYIIYTYMKNSIQTKVITEKLLPRQVEHYTEELALIEGIYREEVTMHPSPSQVLDNIIPDSIMGFIYGALVESFCSEHNARMMAMDAANKSAKDMIHILSMEYNRVRQALITQEITEVIAGAKAQKKKKKGSQAK